MIEYFTYYQLHRFGGNVITGLTEKEIESYKEAGLETGEYVLGPFIGQRLKSDEKEKEQA